MLTQSLRRSPSVLASALATVGILVAIAGCGLAPVGPDGGPSLPPARHLGSPIIVQVMRSRSPTATGGCPAGWLEVFVAPSVLPHASPAGAQPVPGQPPARVTPGTTPSPTPAQTAAASPFPCYHPVGAPVRITAAAAVA